MGNQLQNLDKKQSGGIVIPALLWAGVPLFAVILLWLMFFRG